METCGGNAEAGGMVRSGVNRRVAGLSGMYCCIISASGLSDWEARQDSDGTQKDIDLLYQAVSESFSALG